MGAESLAIGQSKTHAGEDMGQILMQRALQILLMASVFQLCACGESPTDRQARETHEEVQAMVAKADAGNKENMVLLDNLKKDTLKRVAEINEDLEYRNNLEELQAEIIKNQNGFIAIQRECLGQDGETTLRLHCVERWDASLKGIETIRVKLNKLGDPPWETRNKKGKAK